MQEYIRFVRSYDSALHSQAKRYKKLSDLSKLSLQQVEILLPYFVVEYHLNVLNDVLPCNSQTLQELLIAFIELLKQLYDLSLFPGAMCKDALAKANGSVLDKSIYLQESLHLYKVAGCEDAEFTSVTTLIHEHFPPFHEFEQAERCSNTENTDSEYYGHTVDEILAMWEYRRNRGTLAHFIFECIECNLPHDDLITNEEYAAIVQQFYKLKTDLTSRGYKMHYAERIFYCLDRRIAGSCDRLDVDRNGKFVVGDYKIMKDVSRYGFGKKGTSEFTEHIDASKWNMYSMQLYIYSFLLEEKYQVEVSERFIYVVWSDSYKIIAPNPKLKSVVDRLMNHLLKRD